MDNPQFEHDNGKLKNPTDYNGDLQLNCDITIQNDICRYKLLDTLISKM